MVIFLIPPNDLNSKLSADTMLAKKKDKSETEIKGKKVNKSG